MKKTPILLKVIVVTILGAIAAFFILVKKSDNPSSNSNLGECSQFSNKDGYTGCMSIISGKEKKCKFKVDNKINEATQQMEFTYTCSPK
jgi:hypothetical protein